MFLNIITTSTVGVCGCMVYAVEYISLGFFSDLHSGYKSPNTYTLEVMLQILRNKYSSSKSLIKISTHMLMKSKNICR